MSLLSSKVSKLLATTLRWICSSRCFKFKPTEERCCPQATANALRVGYTSDC